MLWPALTWRGQEWARHVQGQLLHTCVMQTAGSPHVMENNLQHLLISQKHPSLTDKELKFHP